MKHPAVFNAIAAVAHMRGDLTLPDIMSRIETAAKNNDLEELKELADDLRGWADVLDPRTA